jgi:oligoendopeptidase F
MQTLQKRGEIATEFTWNLESIFATNEKWERAYQALQGRLPELETLQGSLAQGGPALLAVLRKRDEIYEELERLYVYASMRKDEDTTNSMYQGMADRAVQLYVKASTVASYIEPEILDLEPAVLERSVAETPGLKLYEQQFREIGLKRGHIRSAAIEAILAATGEIADGPGSIFSMIDNADLKLPTITSEAGEEVELTKGNYQQFIRSKQRRVRRDAFEKLHATFLKQRNTIAATLSAQVKADVFYARQHSYASSREQALSRYNIPLSVYDNLLATVAEHIPLLDRYLKLRKRMLQLDELHMYDLYVPIVDEPIEEVSYQQAADTVASALSPLGERYVDTLRQGFTQRWIDVYETPGKRGGAYSGGAYSTQPFILLNFQNNRDSMYTLAHELGHSMHSFFSRHNQPYQYGDYTIFVAEVASTLNESLLTEHLLKSTSDRGIRLAILNHSLEDFRGTLFRQTMFAEFEQEIHDRAERGEPLTADSLSAAYRALVGKYYGGEALVDDLIDIEWARIPHFYSSFYVYQYATGISAAQALAQQIVHEGEPAVERYLRFLSSGSSDFSIGLLQKAGVDMSTPEPVKQAFRLFESHLAQMEELLA